MIAVTPTIETERLRLRGWRNGDLAPLAAFYAFDPGSAWVGGPLDETEAWRRLMSFAGHWSLNGYGLFAIESKDSSAWIGWCGLWKPVDFPETELGWALVEDARGKGYVTEAATAARNFAYESAAVPTLVSYIKPGNKPSQRVAERLGCKHEGNIEIRGFTAEVWRHPPPAS